MCISSNFFSETNNMTSKVGINDTRIINGTLVARPIQTPPMSINNSSFSLEESLMMVVTTSPPSQATNQSETLLSRLLSSLSTPTTSPILLHSASPVTTTVAPTIDADSQLSNHSFWWPASYASCEQGLSWQPLDDPR